MKTATEINKEYKIQKKLEKQNDIMKKKIEKYKLSLEQKKQQAIEKAHSSINARYMKQLVRYEKQRQKTLEKHKRKILGKKPLKKHSNIKTTAKLKQELYTLIQLYVRLLRSDVLGYATCISCGIRTHYKKLQGGHLVGRRNMVTAFDINNIRPQCPRDNMAMAGKFGLDEAKKIENQYIENLKKEIGDDEVNRILNSKGKLKNWNRGDIEDLIVKYKKLNKELEAQKQQPLL